MKKLPKRKKSKSLNILLKIIPVLLILFVLLGVYFIIKPKANDDIYSLGDKGNAIFENVNPNFTVQFGVKDKPDRQWVRFEAKPTTENPFEEDSSTFLQKIADKVLPKSTYGIEMSLKGVQLSQTEQLEEVDEDVLTVAELLGTDEIKTSVELVESGRVIGENNQEPVAKKTVLNKSVVEGVDIEYQILEGIGLKEEIVIRSLEEYTKGCEGNISECKLPLNEFIFDLKIDEGLELKYGWFTYKGKSTKGYYFTDNKGRYVAHFLHNWAIDQSGNKTYDVDFEVLEKEDNHYEAKVTVDINWLFNPERVYPVRIDPSIVHDTKTEFDMGTNYNTEVVDGPKVQIKDNRIPITDTNTSGIWSFDDTSATGFTYYDYDTFESPYPGGNDDWTERNSVDPVISSTTAYSGQYSLYMPSGWGRNFEGTIGETGQTSGAGYDTNTYPYMCMAYKIPSGTDVNMLIYILNVGWRSISMTQPEDQLTSYAKVATWRLMTADNNWQYRCINLDHQLDISLGTGTHTITAVIWHNGGGTYNTGPFYIDDFLIANMPPTKSVKDAGSTDAYIMGNSSLSAGTTEKGMYFDGVDDYVEIPSNFGLTNANVTLEAWVYLDSLSLSGPIIKVGSTGQSGYGIGVGGTYWDANTRGNNLILLFEMVRWVNTGVPVGLGWHHVAMVLNSSGHPSAYLDGKLVYSDTGSVAISPTLNATIIGGYGTARYLNATIDDVRISNTARSEEAIMGSYIAGSSEHTGTHISSEIELDSNSFLDDITWDAYGDATNGEDPFSTSNLVAQWNFNEKSGTTAVSGGTCGSSCNGTLTNMTTTGQDVSNSSGWTYNQRRLGTGALVFDGTDDRVVINSHSSLGATTGLTIEAWVKPYSYSTGGYNHILDKHGTYGLSIYNGKPSLYMTAGGWWHPDIQPLEINKWSHVVATYNGINKTIFVNGVQVAQTLQSGSIGVTSNAVGIGATSAGPYYFNGVIDTTRVYSRAITTSEVISHYKHGDIDIKYRTSLDGTIWSEWNGGEEKKIETMEGNLCSTNIHGLVAYYPMDETSGTVMYDAKGGNNANVSGSYITEGKHNKSRSFTNSSDAAIVSSEISLTGTPYTIETWFKWPLAPSASWNTLTRGSTGDHQVIVQRSTMLLGAYSTDISSFVSSGFNMNNIFAGWHHLAAVASDGTTRFYIDGKLVGTASFKSERGIYAVGNYQLGGQQFGTIDEFKIYNIELTPQQITKNFLQGSQTNSTLRTESSNIKMEGNSSLRIPSGNYSPEGYTAAHWKLDEVSGTGAYLKDNSFYGNHGTPIGTTYTEGKFDGARDFNGSTNYIDIGTAVAPSLPVTISAWVKPDSVLSAAHIVNTGKNQAAAHNHNGVWMTLYNNQVNIGFGNNTACGPGARREVATASATVPVGQWSHVVGVMNSDTSMAIYINGVSVALGAFSGTATTLVNNSSLPGAIGAWTDCGSGSRIAYFDGSIDDVAIVNRAYTGTEIAELYNADNSRNVSREIESNIKEGILMTRYPGYVGHPNNLSEMLADFVVNPGTTAPSATGGTITYSGYEKIHTFTSSGTFTANTNMNVKTLLVAGGGGGANTGSGGGGGGYVYNTKFGVSGQSYSIIVGGGGSGGVATGASGVNGGNSVFSSLTAIGGGGGMSHGNSAGQNGGSGGGGPIKTAAPAATGGIGSQGYNGGVGFVQASWQGNSGGGGGAGGTGVAGGNSAGTGNGGPGLVNSISGSTVYYAGGGGGGEVSGSFVGAGGIGGGGSAVLNAAGGHGTANTGGGGAGGSYTGSYFAGGNGGSGIVIIRSPNYYPVYTKEIVSDVNHSNFGDYYNTMYSTEMEVFVSGTWQFAVDGDDTVIVAVGGTTVAGKYGAGGACNCFTYAGSISLTAGTKYTVNVWHAEDAGGDSARLFYKDPNDSVWKIFSVSNTKGSAKLRAYELPDDRVNTLSYITNGMPSLSELPQYTALPFWIASDRLGTNLELRYGESEYVNYEPDQNTVGYWEMGEIGKDTTLITKVESAGFSDGSRANFWIGNSSYTAASFPACSGGVTRGMFVVTEVNGSKSLSCYDTYGSSAASDAMATYLNGLSSGTKIFMAVYDSANANLTANAKTAITNLGSTSINSLGLRDGWAFIATKGSGKHAEQLVLSGGGVATVFYDFTEIHLLDSSGNNNQGVVTGTSDSAGKVGSARSFNGSSSINLGTPSTLQMTGNQTIEMWLYPTDLSARRNPFAKAYGGEGTITQEMSGVLNYYYGTAGANGTPYQAIGSIEPVIPYTWNHIAVVRDLRNMTLTWYINGKMTNTIAATYASATASSLPAYIGTGYTNPYVGVIDEVRLSDIPRSADEIRQSYEIGKRTHPIKVNFKANLLSANLISSSGDYSFSIDERSYGGNNYIEHLEVGDKIIVKQNYNGVEYIAQGNIATRNKDTGAVTVSGWDSGSTFPSGGYTVNATVFKWQLEYVNLRENHPDDVDDISRLTFSKTTDVGANFWIDDVRLTSYGKTSNNTLAPTDSYLYGSSDNGLVAYFPMDETSGQLVKNVAGTKSGIATGTTVTTGYNSNARSFNGSSDYLSLAYNPVFNPSVLTVASWIKTNSSATQSVVALPGCDFDQSPCAYTPYQLYIDGGYLKAQLYNNSSQTITLTSPTQVNTNNWHHVALSFGGGVAKLFIDGEVVASDSLSGTMSQVTNDRLFIGATWLYSTGVGRYFAGLIDEVRIYNRALSADEILLQYDSRMKYVQYSAMFSRWNSNTDLDLYLSGLTVNYTPDGPTMDQIMRHGKWFTGGVKQPYWWAK